MSHKRKLSFEEAAGQWICHAVSILISAIMAVFALPGAVAVWPAHPKIGSGLALLCALAACVGHIRFCAQFGTTRPTQSRSLLGAVIVIFSVVSIMLGAIAEYQQYGEPSIRSDSGPIAQAHYADYGNKGDGAEDYMADRTRSQPSILVVSFFGALRRASAEALVPFLIGCFLEVLPIATLLLLVPRKRRNRSAAEPRMAKSPVEAEA